MTELDWEDECTCEDSFDEHQCPFALDVNDDPDFLCTCCPECEYQCAMDI